MAYHDNLIKHATLLSDLNLGPDELRRVASARAR